MNELKARCMKSDASNSPFGRFRRVVFPVADYGVSDRGKLHSDLVLQSRHQHYSDERRVPQNAIDAVA